MNEITGFYIIAREGVLLFSHELFTQGSEDWDLALLSSTISAMQSFAVELGHKIAHTIEIGDIKLYTSLSDEYGVFFVVKCNMDSSETETGEILENIKKAFLTKYQDFFKTEYYKKVIEGDLEIRIFNEFQTELLKIVKVKSAVQIFLENI